MGWGDDGREEKQRGPHQPEQQEKQQRSAPLPSSIAKHNYFYIPPVNTFWIQVGMRYDPFSCAVCTGRNRGKGAGKDADRIAGCSFFLVCLCLLKRKKLSCARFLSSEVEGTQSEKKRQSQSKSGKPRPNGFNTAMQ